MGKARAFIHAEQEVVFDCTLVAELESLDGENGRNLLEDLCDLYVATTPELIEHLQRAYRVGDVARMNEIAHSLKSSSANLGFKLLQKACYFLESNSAAIVAKGDSALVDELSDLYAQSVGELKNYLKLKRAA